MITLEMLCYNLPEITANDVYHWINNQWLRPEKKEGNYLVKEIDEARAKLILELRDHLGVAEDSMSLVLQLLDQLYTTRRQMRYLCEVISTEKYPDVQQILRRILDDHSTIEIN